MFAAFQKKLTQWIGPLKIKAGYVGGNKHSPALEIEQEYRGQESPPLLIKANFNGYIPNGVGLPTIEPTKTISYNINGQNALSFYGNGNDSVGDFSLRIGRNNIGIMNYCGSTLRLLNSDAVASFEASGIAFNRPFITVGTYATTGNEPRLYNGGSGIFEQKNKSDVTQHYLLYARFVSATSYQRSGLRSVKETVTLIGSSVSTFTLIIPKYSQLIGVTTRVNTALGTTNGTTGYLIGDGTDADLWGAITGTAVGTSSDSSNYTALNALGPSSVDRTVTITAVGGDFDGTGVIDVCAFYLRTEAD